MNHNFLLHIAEQCHFADTDIHTYLYTHTHIHKISHYEKLFIITKPNLPIKIAEST